VLEVCSLEHVLD